MAKKQTKADKAFIAKISTLNIGGKATSPDPAPKQCGCGAPLHHVGNVKGNFHGKEVEGAVFMHGLPSPAEMRRLMKGSKKEQPASDEQSFSA